MAQKQNIVDQLKYYLTLQLEVYHRHDQMSYEDLERKISELEKKL